MILSLFVLGSVALSIAARCVQDQIKPPVAVKFMHSHHEAVFILIIDLQPDNQWL